MNIELNKEEAQALFQLIDLAVKSGGIQVAAVGAHLAKKLDDAAKAESENKDKE